MTRQLANRPFERPRGVFELPRDEWLVHYDRITGTPTSTQPLHAALLRGIHNEHVFQVNTGGTEEPLSCGLAVAELGLVGLFDIATSATARRAGHGRRTVEALLAWGSTKGADHAYLQVVADNADAIALYRSLGFETLYRYWYRVGAA